MIKNLIVLFCNGPSQRQGFYSVDQGCVEIPDQAVYCQ